MTVGLWRPAGAASDFERFYRDTVGDVTAFFARRTDDPHAVADLTQETFVRAIASRDSLDPRRGSPRAWLFGIARHVHADHWERVASQRAVAAVGGARDLQPDEIDELVERIDAQRGAREYLARCGSLSETERAAIELVDLAGLRPVDAARALGVSPGALRIRLFRARARLRQGEER